MFLASQELNLQHQIRTHIKTPYKENITHNITITEEKTCSRPRHGGDDVEPGVGKSRLLSPRWVLNVMNGWRRAASIRLQDSCQNRVKVFRVVL